MSKDTAREPWLESVEQSLQALVELLSKGTIGAGSLSGGGKLNPRQGLPGGSGINKPKKPKRRGRLITILKPKKKAEEPEGDTVAKSIQVSILKQNDEEQTVTGVVLQPEVVDAQGDIISAEVIKDAAFKFLATFNQSTRLGVQHKDFKTKGRLALVESYISPMNLVLGGKTVLEGSWIMTVKVLDPALWKSVKDGKITGFSIGGRARVKNIAQPGNGA